MNIQVCGETLELLAERAVYWGAQQMLLVADVHCGKAATFRARHVPVPEGDMDDDLDRLTRLIQTTGAREVAILGDWIHAAAGCTASVVRSIVQWRELHSALRIYWVRGNHDRAPEALRAQFGFEECEFLQRGPFRLEHVPRKCEGAFVIGGHIHPKVVIGGRGFPRSHVPCFHFTRDFAVLPAFGSFTGGYPVKREVGSRVFLIADEAVVEWAN